MLPTAFLNKSALTTYAIHTAYYTSLSGETKTYEKKVVVEHSRQAMQQERDSSSSQIMPSSQHHAQQNAKKIHCSSLSLSGWLSFCHRSHHLSTSHAKQERTLFTLTSSFSHSLMVTIYAPKKETLRRRRGHLHSKIADTNLPFNFIRTRNKSVRTGRLQYFGQNLK